MGVIIYHAELNQRADAISKRENSSNGEYLFREKMDMQADNCMFPLQVPIGNLGFYYRDVKTVS